MAELLQRIKNKTAYSYLDDSQRIDVLYVAGQPATLSFESGAVIKSSCINCFEESCLKIKVGENVWDDLRMSQTDVLCPTDAVFKDDDGNVSIDSDKCIGCGLCIAVCPVGAIHFNNQSKAVIHRDLSNLKRTDTPVVLNSLNISHSNQPIIESEPLIRGVLVNINMLDSRTATINRLVCKALQVTGIDTFLTRQGDVNMRMDGISAYGDFHILVEVETVANLDSPRDILDDVAVFCSRNNVDKSKVKGMIVLPELPNKRTEFWELISDIKNVVDLDIMIVPLTALLSVAWNKTAMDVLLFNLSKDNTSAREGITILLGREPNLASPCNLVEAAK
ncbi:4Fe-4S binding protein [Rheinheimera sp.]|uniref:4Fe-4S binding protein n=1 Tax=Rheinheimera sp. TaxID=1869214 RepID=UPI00273654F3|nr:4Fe-4S binding protein [Rheinheimera sp.]MDP2716485.1 4Fe-4S binding protein [Rheinheimera sp.]